MYPRIFFKTLQPGAEAAVDEGFGGVLVGGKVIVACPAAHELCQDDVGVKVVEDEEVLCSSSGNGWEAAREVSGDASHDGLAVHVQVPCVPAQRVPDGRLRFVFGMVGLRRRCFGRLR